MIAIDLLKQQALESDPKAIQQITFTGSQSGNNNKLMFFIIEEAKETTLDFSERNVKVLQFYAILRWYQYKMTQHNTLNIKLSNS